MFDKLPKETKSASIAKKQSSKFLPIVLKMKSMRLHRGAWNVIASFVTGIPVLIHYAIAMDAGDPFARTAKSSSSVNAAKNTFVVSASL